MRRLGWVLCGDWAGCCATTGLDAVWRLGVDAAWRLNWVLCGDWAWCCVGCAGYWCYCCAGVVMLGLCWVVGVVVLSTRNGRRPWPQAGSRGAAFVTLAAAGVNGPGEARLATWTLRPCSACNLVCRVMQVGGIVTRQNTRMEDVPMFSTADPRRCGALNSYCSILRIGVGHAESIALRLDLSGCSPCH